MSKEIKQNTDYGYDIQKLYLEMMLADAETFVRCQSIFDHTLFDRKLQPAADFINHHVSDHNTRPTFEIVKAATKVELQSPGNINDQHLDWLMGEFETFTRHKSLERAILQAADMLEKGEYGPVEGIIKEAVQISLQKDLGIDYYESPNDRLQSLKNRNGQMSTGWPSLDQKMYGGFNKGELVIFAAQSGGGKSVFLANLAVNYSQAGSNVVYVTLELSEELVGMRIDAMTTGIASREIFKNLDEVNLKVKMMGKKNGAIQLKYMPSGKTANDIRSYLKEYQVKTGKKVDVLVIDYLDLLMPNGKKISAENLFIKDKYVSEELRNLAMELNCLTISAAQLNRGAVEEQEFDHSHISGGLSKIQTADAVFGIFTSRAMRERGKYQLQFMKTRNSGAVGQNIELDFNVDTLRITDPGLDEVEEQGMAKPTAILDAIKRKTLQSGGAEPVKEEPKVRAKTPSARLRNFLNHLPNPDPLA